ncbi:TIGR04104 family putative zinc finger protein [Jeotgalibacillus terrae]|uniref:TIGR04104 family putative zinc finger protein n=1 Tax=Jeotgalibacillus terrae TaxID=587735 RepID=A0ABW5ZHI3_9BACL|nr:TIGR04104 family putative zinc finger protein [Jeotgalibacillus terrae]MBM7580885.1 CXXC-20-CXXC protein [Jeotgalibacillus terrae]
MPTCQNCHQKWSWTTAFKRTVWFNGGMECPHCGAKQYVTKNTRKRSASLSGLSSFAIIFSALILDVSWSGLIILAVTIFLIAMIILPSAVRLSNEDEPLW